MPYQTFTQKQEITATDIQNMAEMTMEEYKQYIRTGLLFVDHHDVLRSKPAGYPLAATKEQFKTLIAYLRELEPRVGAA